MGRSSIPIVQTIADKPFLKVSRLEADEMSQQVKAFVAKAYGLCSIPGTHINVGGGNQFLKVVL